MRAGGRVTESLSKGAAASNGANKRASAGLPATLKNLRLAFSNGQFAVAESHLHEAEAQGLPAKRVLDWSVRIAIQQGNFTTARALIERQIDDVTLRQNQDKHVKLGWVCLRQGDYIAALEQAERALAKDSGNVKAQILAAVAATKNGDAERAVIAYSELMRLEPENPQWLAKKVGLLTQTGANAQAIALIREGVGRGLESFELFQHAHLLALPSDLVIRALHWARALREEAPLGLHKAARRVMELYAPPEHLVKQPAPVDGGAVDWAYDWDAPLDSELKRSLVKDIGHEDVVVGMADNPKAIVMVFTGLADQAMVPIEMLDRYFAALNVSAIYLRDPDRLLFNKGIASLAEGFEGTVDHLRTFIAESGAARLVTIGTSAGGYAAMRYGLSLGAEKIVCFSAPTNLKPDFLADDGRGRIVARRLQSLPPQALDVRPMIQAQRGKADIHLVFGEKMSADSRHAHYLEGVAGVTLHPLAGVDSHGSLAVLAQEKKLRPFLAETILTPSGS